MSIELVMLSNHLIPCRPLLLLHPIFPSVRVSSNESALCIKWPKNWSFSFSISPSNEYPGLICFRMDWLELLAVQGTPRSLLQHHSSKASTSVKSFQTCILFSHILHSILDTVITVQLLSRVQLCNPMDCREIHLVHPKGDQSWVFIGRTDVEAETPILWPPDVKNTHWKRP